LCHHVGYLATGRATAQLQRGSNRRVRLQVQSEERIDPLLDEAAALHRQGALGEAGDRYARILEGDPTNATALYSLAQICCQQGRFADGVAWARRALAVEPQRARSHVLLGRALAELGETQEALASFDRAVAC